MKRPKKKKKMKKKQRKKEKERKKTLKSNRPFLSSPQSLFQSESKCETFVMKISSNFNMNEN